MYRHKSATVFGESEGLDTQLINERESGSLAEL